jgi:uncharacterized protein YeaO (DUF488 family)
MSIVLKRAYENPGPADGYRVLVDRLWPRGISKERADLDEWMREVSPSEELRKWYHGESGRWSESRRRYLSELKTHRNKLRGLAGHARRRRLSGSEFRTRWQMRAGSVHLLSDIRLVGGFKIVEGVTSNKS